MPAMFRLVQLWLELAAEPDVNARVAQCFGSVPSHKFLGLVYQMASRMSSAAAGPLVASGFQVGLGCKSGTAKMILGFLDLGNKIMHVLAPLSPHPQQRTH